MNSRTRRERGCRLGSRGRSRGVIVVVATAVATVSAGGALLLLSAVPQSVAVDDAPAGAPCLVSDTSSHPVPGRPSFDLGDARIAVDLPTGAEFVAVPDGSPGRAFLQSNGWIRAKLGWFAASGTPRVSGRRLDRRGGQLRADVGPLSSASGGPFYPSLLFFLSLGCWRITATAAGARLTAVVLVVRARRR